MSDSTTRRSFLRTAATASGALVLSSSSLAAPSGSPVPVANGPARSAPLMVVAQAVSRDSNPRAAAWGYIAEILERAGVFYQELATSGFSALARRPGGIVLLAGDLPLTADQRQALATWVAGGGALVGLGGTSGLDDLFGVRDARRLAEGWIQVAARDHPLTAGLRSSLHVFGGCVVKPAAATPLASVDSAHAAMKGGAILEHRVGKGRAILLAPDLLFSIVHIQQGVPVFQDGKPAPDKSGLVGEGILKAEDGMVLDWQRDRSPMEPDGIATFLEPVTDELRELILRSIFYAARQQGIALPILWYWPRALPAVGQISHDSDGNDPQRAKALLEVMNRCRVKSTWCMLYPGGYPREFCRALADQGFEIALHYDALGGGPQTSWCKEHLLFQRDWLLKEASLSRIRSNKNHYTRWEGRLEFWRWCEQAGILSDQTRGPSKQGTIGFALGGSQPYFPWDDEADSPRRLPVLEVNLLTQDLVVVCPAEYGRQLMDSAVRHHGVAHFLFHPAHILKAPVAEALAALVDYGKAQGVQWWTNDQISEWETSRRAVKASFDSPTAFTLAASRPLAGATLLFLNAGPGQKSIRIDNRPVATQRRTVYGFEFDSVTFDLAGRISVRV